jgi:hypothetical protein
MSRIDKEGWGSARDLEGRREAAQTAGIGMYSRAQGQTL